MSSEKDYLIAAANVVERQMAEEPDLSIPVDPDVAEHMGAFLETAVGLEDFFDFDIPALRLRKAEEAL